jgi:hypothetical protein
MLFILHPDRNQDITATTADGSYSSAYKNELGYK